jgi:hypothetical protein
MNLAKSVVPMTTDALRRKFTIYQVRSGDKEKEDEPAFWHLLIWLKIASTLPYPYDKTKQRSAMKSTSLMPGNAIFALLLFIVSPGTSFAWQNDYPNSPVNSKDQPHLRLAVPRRVAPTVLPKTAALTATTAPFRRRTVRYPITDGLGLGYGWDFIQNQKKFASCVLSTAVPDDNYRHEGNHE